MYVTSMQKLRFICYFTPNRQRYETGNATAPVMAKGDVQITVSNGKQDKAITLQNALYVPTLRTNLMSIAKIVDKKLQVLFIEKQAYVKDTAGKVKMVVDRDLFYLRESENTTYAVSSNTSDSSTEWHRKLGHLNWKDMLTMLRNDMVSGLNFKVDHILPVCDACAAGKLTSLPFPKRGKRTSIPLEIVHTDLCGPMRKESHGDASFF